MSDILIIFFGVTLGGVIVLSLTIFLIKKYPRSRFQPDTSINTEDKQSGVYVNDIKIWRAILLITMVALGYKLIGASFYAMYESIYQENDINYLAFIYSYAWLAYITMGIFWAADRQVWKFIPLTGTVAGTIGVLSVAVLVIPLIYVAPHVIFAYHLAKYHLHTS